VNSEAIYRELLSPLAEGGGLVFLSPCTAAELNRLKQALRLPLPTTYMSLMGCVGLIQDLFCGTARTTGGMQLAAERFAKTFGSADHFPFAHDGEATLLLRHAPDDERSTASVLAMRECPRQTRRYGNSSLDTWG
jgi:hypothetical protein